MERIFSTVINMSCTGGIIILAVQLLRLFGRRAPKLFPCFLWIIVLFRLLCPFSFSLDFSLLGALQAPADGQGRMAFFPEEGFSFEEPAVYSVAFPRTAVSVSVPARTPDESVLLRRRFITVGSALWLAGIVCFLSCGLLSWLRLLKRLKTARWEQANIYRAEGIRTAFVYGLLRPRIYLPASLGDGERSYILLHEQIHIRRLDHIWRAVWYLALCLHWFNPLVWVAFSQSGRDMEMSCDEAVIRRTGSSIKKSYSASLLSLSADRRIIPGQPLLFGEKDTAGRIKNILRYRKPGLAAICLLTFLLVCAIPFLLANPGKKEKEAAVFYGVISSDLSDENVARTVIVPPYGELIVPEAEEIYPYIEIDFSGPEAGDLVRISFHEGEEVFIQETWPGSFSATAESIAVMGRGFELYPREEGRFLVTVPIGMAPDAQEDDLLEISQEDPGTATVNLLARVPVLSVDAANYHIYVELSAAETQAFLSGFGSGVFCTLTDRTPEKEEMTGEIPVMFTGEEIDTPTPEILSQNSIPDGIYRVFARSFSPDLTGLKDYLVDGWDKKYPLPLLAFAEDCSFQINREMDRIRYEAVSVEEFASLTEEAARFSNPALLLTFRGGMVVRAILETYYGKGISLARPEANPLLSDGQIADVTDEDLMAGYTLSFTERLDVGDSAGDEEIQVYTGDTGDGDSGIVLFRDARGRLLYARYAHTARAGWDNIYLGEREGVRFILCVHIEDRDTYGSFSYLVFRLAGNGAIRQLAGSSFDFDDDRIPYDDHLFRSWAEKLEDYLESSHLILSTQEGELNTRRVSEADKYNYETLRRRKQ